MQGAGVRTTRRQVTIGWCNLNYSQGRLQWLVLMHAKAAYGRIHSIPVWELAYGFQIGLGWYNSSTLDTGLLINCPYPAGVCTTPMLGGKGLAFNTPRLAKQNKKQINIKKRLRRCILRFTSEKAR